MFGVTVDMYPPPCQVHEAKTCYIEVDVACATHYMPSAQMQTECAVLLISNMQPAMC